MSVREISRYLSVDIIISFLCKVNIIIFHIKILTKLSIKHNKNKIKEDIMHIFCLHYHANNYSMDLGFDQSINHYFFETFSICRKCRG